MTWKSGIYALIDSSFRQLIGQIDEPVIATQIQWGGVRRGGIPELNSEPVITVADADYMLDDGLTFGAVINGEARSYPHHILDRHELANDTLGGEPVALANCTLCRTGVLYSRAVDGRILDFQTSGLLRNSNKVMVDVQTGSLWNQLTGESIAGSLKGTVLDRFPPTVTLYGQWIAEHPETTVVAIPTTAAYSYEPGDAYREYYSSSDLWFPTLETPGRFDPKDEVGTLELEGEQLAVSIEELTALGPQRFNVGRQAVIAVPTTGGARFYLLKGDLSDERLSAVADATWGEDALVFADGEQLARLQSGQSFWFAWCANYPDTDWWPK